MSSLDHGPDLAEESGGWMSGKTNDDFPICGKKRKRNQIDKVTYYSKIAITNPTFVNIKIDQYELHFTYLPAEEMVRMQQQQHSETNRTTTTTRQIVQETTKRQTQPQHSSRSASKSRLMPA